jgi:hypothetical protein
MQDDGKTDPNGDDSGANQRKIYCRLVHGKGENVGYGLHLCFLFDFVLRGTGSNIIGRG